MRPSFCLSDQSARATLLALVCLSAGVSTSLASNGFFDYGYGIKAKGIGGAGVAFPQDSLAPATNPAGAVFIADRLDFGLNYSRSNNSATLGATTLEGDSNETVYISEIGIKTSLTPNLAFDLAIYNNGGTDSSYPTPIPGIGTSPASIALGQLFIAPTLALKLKDAHALGLAPILAYQRFKANGLESYGLAKPGYDYSHGAGLRLGYTGDLASWFTLGATYQTRVFMTKLDTYRGLLAEQGDFDIPSNFALGFAVRPNERLTFAFDVERIFYSEVNSIGNNFSLNRLGNGIGADEGPGFGWHDVTVIKTGIAYAASDALTLRLGYNHGSQPVPANQTYINMLGTGIAQDHATVGFSWKYSEQWEFSGFYGHTFESKVKGSGNVFGPPSDADLRMSQDTFGLSLGWLY
jgi:long-chain fatty acid transport protein